MSKNTIWIFTIRPILASNFLVATLLTNISFFSSGVNLLNASNSIKFFFCSSVNSAFFSFGFSSLTPSFCSLFSSVVASLLAVIGFFVGKFFFKSMKNKNYIIMSILFLIFFIFDIFFDFIFDFDFIIRKDFKINF